MLISGFTFVRNINKLKYPAVEAILSILPICDEFIVNVCESEDDTLETIKSINSSKIRIIHSTWDASMQKDGLILSNQTNIALEECKGTWCFYIQGDEVCHEEDLPQIRLLCEKNINDYRVEGFVFNYLHFYGSYNVLATARNWYRREVRIVRNHIGVKSVGDAQGFKIAGRKLNVMANGARIFHYGWARSPEDMGFKNKHFSRLWHGNKFDNAFDKFKFEQQYGLKYYNKSHPKIMLQKIASQNWDFNIDKKMIAWNFTNARYLFSDIIENISGIRLGEYKNFVILE